MRMKINQKIAGGASAIDKLAAVRSVVDDTLVDVEKLYCLALVTQSAVHDILFNKSARSERPGFYYAGDDDRRVLGFSVSEVEAHSREIDSILTELSEDLREIQLMLESQASKAGSE
ncbi:hypothetical protein [Agrobacterium tumefaciens]|uniref:hypothetical protein n=1 Tax=Agrobacterium tumefaciens TaxID=358 RepID=UPI00157357E1|nr:hypothetical protein [Agrobacterium tumefaciens]NTE36671.1 hypothetical protein [Agrobacterium tumefaciens]NTE52182.1 hypothetical protein [Agrobacterium tumefaciens]